jgi:hypothetical protein
MNVEATYYTVNRFGNIDEHIADPRLADDVRRLISKKTINASDRALLTGILNHFGIVLEWKEIVAPKK